MAAGTTLQMVFRDVDANNVTFNFKHGDSTVADSAVQALAACIINHNAIYQNPPTTIVSAKFITTTERSINFN